MFPGMAVMYGDDLTSVVTPSIVVNDGAMWSWLAHELMLKSAKMPLKKADLHTAGK